MGGFSQGGESMSPENDVSSIADASRPNAGRIYDFLLGGNHNFEIDRQAAEQLLQMIPELPQWFRLIRWFLGEAVRRLLEEGFTHFLDFASGLPTVDHIHQIAPKGTKVIYSDIDPVTVAYAQEIIQGIPDVAYVECNVAEPEKILNSKITSSVFGKQKKVAIGLSGIAWFIPDAVLEHSLSVLYDWAGAGSKLYISDNDLKSIPDSVKATLEFYKKIGQPTYLRPIERTMELVGKWKIQEPGFLPIVDWVKLGNKSIEKALETSGGNNLKGAILAK
jgi:hypothetical protein